MKPSKSVGILQKIKGEDGAWRFVPVKKTGSKYLWGDRPETYFLDWWEGTKRRRKSVGTSPSKVLEARRRKTNELLGQMLVDKSFVPEVRVESQRGTAIESAAEAFLQHVEVHSPDNPRTVQRYRIVLEHFSQLLGKLRFIEAVQRRHIDEYKASRGRR